jgi:hypothetical protein
LNEQRRWPTVLRQPISAPHFFSLRSLEPLATVVTAATMPALKDDMQMREEGFGSMQVLQLVFTVMRASV